MFALSDQKVREAHTGRTHGNAHGAVDEQRSLDMRKNEGLDSTECITDDGAHSYVFTVTRTSAASGAMVCCALNLMSIRMRFLCRDVRNDGD